MSYRTYPFVISDKGWYLIDDLIKVGIGDDSKNGNIEVDTDEVVSVILEALSSGMLDRRMVTDVILYLINYSDSLDLLSKFNDEELLVKLRELLTDHSSEYHLRVKVNRKTRNEYDDLVEQYAETHPKISLDDTSRLREYIQDITKSSDYIRVLVNNLGYVDRSMSMSDEEIGIARSYVSDVDDAVVLSDANLLRKFEGDLIRNSRN